MPTPADCLFCKIAGHEIPVQAVFEDEHHIAFPDINPQAPTHVLIIPKPHCANIAAAPVEVVGALTHCRGRACAAAASGRLSHCGEYRRGRRTDGESLAPAHPGWKTDELASWLGQYVSRLQRTVAGDPRTWPPRCRLYVTGFRPGCGKRGRRQSQVPAG